MVDEGREAPCYGATRQGIVCRKDTQKSREKYDSYIPPHEDPCMGYSSDPFMGHLGDP